MKAALHKSSIELDNELGNDLTKTFESSDKNVMPFMSFGNSRKQSNWCQISPDDYTILLISHSNVSFLLQRTQKQWCLGIAKSAEIERL